MPFTKYALDEFFAQELSKLTECNALEVGNQFPQSTSWVSNFALNTIFVHQVGQEAKRFAFAFLRRAEAAFIEYAHARQALIEFVTTGSKKPSIYFRALTHFETTIAFLYQAYDFAREFTSTKLFQKGDGSNYERLNRVYNVSRHFKPADLPADHLHALWLTNDGIQINSCIVSFKEIGDFLVEIGKLADRVSGLSPNQKT